MKVIKIAAAYQPLRTQPLWRLLAADKAPIVIALLQVHLLEGEKSVSASLFFERLHRDLEQLRAQGEDFPQTAQAYAADWLAAGYIERRFPPGSSEEEYEISASAAAAVRFILSLTRPHTNATESRLAVVMQQLIRLAEETDTDRQTRLMALLAERERIDQEIQAVQKGDFKALPDARAIERIREIILLADGLAGDFRRVRDEFAQLNRSLREQVMSYEGNRGEVLEALFSGVDVISSSEAGCTFSAFWRLLTDPEQSTAFEQALDQVMSRPFSRQLDGRERRFLLGLTRLLLDQGGQVHETLQHFARSLKHFVQSREYLEQRRLHELLKLAQCAALSLKEDTKTTHAMEYTLQLTSSRIRSISQWSLYDPMLQVIEGNMMAGETAIVDLAAVSALLAQSEIDFRRLKENIRAILQTQSQASIAEILNQFPATQGLGTVVGYIALGSRHGINGEQNEIIHDSLVSTERSAKI